MITPHWRRCGAASLFCFAAACSQAQVAKVETGIPEDAAFVSCVITTAIATGGDVAAVAVACGADAAKVAEILYEAATLPRGATNRTVAVANMVRSTTAFADAYEHYPRAAH